MVRAIRGRKIYETGGLPIVTENIGDKQYDITVNHWHLTPLKEKMPRIGRRYVGSDSQRKSFTTMKGKRTIYIEGLARGRMMMRQSKQLFLGRLRNDLSKYSPQEIRNILLSVHPTKPTKWWGTPKWSHAPNEIRKIHDELKQKCYEWMQEGRIQDIADKNTKWAIVPKHFSLPLMKKRADIMTDIILGRMINGCISKPAKIVKIRN